MSVFRIEGNVCFARVPPGFEIRYEFYDFYQDGDRNIAITVRPIPPEIPHSSDCAHWIGEPCDCVTAKDAL